MELRQLEYFREIASTGSINEAARHLNMSQPPLSYQIRQLETFRPHQQGCYPD